MGFSKLQIRLSELIWDDLYDKLDEIYHLKWRVLDSNDEFQTVNRTSNGYLIRDLTPSTSYETSIQVQGFTCDRSFLGLG